MSHLFGGLDREKMEVIQPLSGVVGKKHLGPIEQCGIDLASF